MTTKDAMDQQLVQLIAREVLAQLAARGVQSGGAASAVPSRQGAVVNPPLGTCTGGHGRQGQDDATAKPKYPDLSERLNPPRPASPLPDATTPAISVLTGIVTENQLRQAIAASAQGVAVLSPAARLTPLANDFARQFPDKVKRSAQVSPGAEGQDGGVSPSLAKLPWLWWIQGQCPVVQQVVSQRADRLRTITAPRDGEQLSRVVRELAQAVKAGQAAGGLLFVPSAARATCLANRCQSLRAVVATSGQAVEEGVRDLGANVLVIEYPHHGPRSVSAMVDRLIGQPPMVPAAVSRDLADLHRCG